MEWERAKTLILVLFILLNAVLGVFMFREYRRYTVQAEQEAVIREVLTANRISMYTEMLRRFPPMRTLRVSGYYYDEAELLEMFFPDPARVTRTEDEWGVEFTCETAALLWISGGFVTYFNPRGLGLTPQEFIARHYPDFVHDARFAPHDEEGERLIFRQEYRGFIVYSNYIEFLVTDAGVVEVVMQFGQVDGWYGPEQPIFAPDEALITFVQRIPSFTDEPVMIRHMDIVYFLEFANASDEVGSTHLAVPFYRIFTDEFDMPFLINAFTNVSIDV